MTMDSGTPYEEEQMKSLMSLWKVLAKDFGERCSVDTLRDYETVAKRYENEGMSFLTITLPAFGKAFERWLDQGQVRPEMSTGFSAHSGLPRFLSGFLGLVFHTSDGAILESPNADAILAIRQLCGLYGKMFLQATPERTSSAMKGFLDVDREVEEIEHTFSPEGILELQRVFTLLFGRVCGIVNQQIAEYDLIPRHGNGSTAERILGNQKFIPKVWHERLEPFFPSADYLLPNWRYYTALQSVHFSSPEEELPVRVISVPKTQKTPRIIAIEPVCMQYTQQAVAGALVEAVESDRIAQRFIRFTDQVPNQVLARVGSLDGTLATLDLSEASDRVSNKLLTNLVMRWEHLSGAIQACRSRRALVQLGKGKEVIHTLAKFASMGSALTFPLEAMVFTAIVFRGIEKSRGKRLSLSDLSEYASTVAIYGDDIIVPTGHVGSVVHELESFGFRVNSSKSFWNGKFRESCGKDYYGGIDVSFVKFRSEWPGNRQSAEEIASLVSFFNQCKDAGYRRTVRWLRNEIIRLLGVFPKVPRDCGLLGEFDDVETDIAGWDRDLHRPRYRAWAVKSHIPENVLDDHWALLKWFLKEGDMPFDEDHLLRSGRSSSVSIEMRWTTT